VVRGFGHRRLDGVLYVAAHEYDVYGKSHVAPEVAKHVHESPASMTVPLTLLAIGSVLAGWLGTPKLWNLPESFRAFERWLQPSLLRPRWKARTTPRWSGCSWSLVAVAIIGIVIARYFYNNRPSIPDSIERSCKPLYTVLYNKWYVDEIYDFLFVKAWARRRPCGGAFDRNVWMAG